MTKKLTPPLVDPAKDQLRRILWLVGDLEQEKAGSNFVTDVVYFVQKYVTTTNNTIMELKRKVAMLEARLEKQDGS